MPFLDRLTRTTPDWTAFMNHGAYEAFMVAVRDHLSAAQVPFEIREDGRVSVGSGPSPTYLWLTNLAQTCDQSARADWVHLIAKHIDSILEVVANESTQERGGYEAAAPNFRIRLVPDDYLDDFPVPGAPLLEGVFRPFAPGLSAALALDAPDHVEFVMREFADEWGVEDDELFAVATENVFAKESVAVRRVGKPPAAVTMVAGDSFYVAAHALRLERYVVPGSAHGAIFAVPNRHVIIVEPIRSRQILAAIQFALETAADLYSDGPGSIRPYLYWWRDGQVKILGGSSGRNEMRFSPPSDFVELVEGLPEK
jgi:hypothetical protein